MTNDEALCHRLDGAWVVSVQQCGMRVSETLAQ
jgi:hypothetical protein